MPFHCFLEQHGGPLVGKCHPLVGTVELYLTAADGHHLFLQVSDDLHDVVKTVWGVLQGVIAGSRRRCRQCGGQVHSLIRDGLLLTLILVIFSPVLLPSLIVLSVKFCKV